jgi:hypothetical protein
MIVRALDSNHDWTFGKGKNNFYSGLDAVVQSIDTRLHSFLGDCFFSTQDGIDWFHLLGGKNRIAITNAINTTILNTQGVTGVVEISINVDNNRLMTAKYKATTVYSTDTVIGSVTVGV